MNALASLVSGVVDDAQRLFSQEIELAKAETRENLRATQRKLIYLGGGALIAWQGVTFALLAAVFALATVWPPYWAALAVGVVLLVAGAIGLAVGMKLSRTIVPKKTMDSIREDVRWISRAR